MTFTSLAGRGRRRGRAARRVAAISAVLAMTTVLPAGPASAATLSGATPVSPTTWRLQGSAYADGQSLVLTQASSWRIGTAFYPRVMSSSNLSVSFRSRIGGGTGGQGMTLTLLDAATGKPVSKGRGGAGEGFAGLPGVAVSLDTKLSPGDPSGNFVGLATGGTGSALNYSATTGSLAPLRDRDHTFTVTAASGKVRVVMDGTTVLTATTKLPSKVYVGFTAANDAGYDQHTVSGVSVSGTAAYSEAAEFASFVGYDKTVDDWTATVGRRPTTVTDFQAGGSWDDITGITPSSGVSRWKDDYRVVLGVPMLPADGSTLAAGATGAYDEQWRTFARNLIANNMQDADLRIGWEFNGNWYRWSAKDDPATWAAYWRRIVTAMRSVPGQNFTFDWNVNLGYNALADPTLAWPGDGYVDEVGIQVYDTCWCPDYPVPAGASAQEATSRRTAVWNRLLNGHQGIEFWASFAARHGKPLTVPEYGLSDEPSHGGGDNPVFVQGMHDMLLTHDVVFASYFDATGGLGDHRLSNPTFGNAAALYRSLFTS